MELEVTGPSEILIRGNIKSIENYRDIKKAVEGLVQRGAGNITIDILESLSMTSSVIGFFVKLVSRDNVKVNMHVHDRRLYETLGELKLIDIFGVHFSGKP
jgi:hypothetical protein